MLCIQYGNYESISAYEINIHKESVLLFSAIAEIRSISFQEGPYGHLRFAWALGGGSSGSVSFNGTKFDVTSPTVDTGEVYVTSSMLQ